MARHAPYRLLIWLGLSVVVISIPLRDPSHTNPPQHANVTITAPEGTTNHSGPRPLCTQTRWINIAGFFFGNYVAHIVTVKSVPGQRTLPLLFGLLMALFLPSSGVFRAIKAIYHHASLCKTSLESATKAGALCMVVRTESWKPRSGDVVRGVQMRPPPPAATHPQDQENVPEQSTTLPGYELNSLGDRGHSSLTLKVAHKPPEYTDYRHRSSKARDKETNGCRFWPSDRSILNTKSRRVHGKCTLPPGYALQILPPTAVVSSVDAHQSSVSNGPATARDSGDNPRPPRTNPRILGEISRRYEPLKSVFAILYAIIASATLNHTRGDQIHRLGYAAFGLTVSPYLVMSLANLLSTMLTPHFRAVYLVKSDIMDEALRREEAYVEEITGVLESDGGVRSDVDAIDVVFETWVGDRMFMRPLQRPLTERWADALGNLSEVVEVDVGGQVRSYADTPRNTQLLVPALSHVPINLSAGEGRGRFFTAWPRSHEQVALIVTSWIVCLIPLAITGVLSRFQTGPVSTIPQRVLAMAWLAIGIIWGPVTGAVSEMNYEEAGNVSVVPLLAMLALLVSAGAPAVGGFVFVGQMIKSYGHCGTI